MTIEIISIRDCPNHQPAVERVKAVLSSGSLSAEIREILISDLSQAQSMRFQGSPTVRVNGMDVEPLSPGAAALSCRIYEDGTGLPPESLLKRAIGAASQSEG